ncbi:MAG: GyrI-like domain-containing protein [Chloroflexota bacterium]|nr:GyrI-like domain-containing protein [Chloroflexota bacterium]
MQTLDLKKDLKNLYSPSAKEPTLVDVPAMQFVMIDGAIEEGQTPSTSSGFQEVMQALYGAAYTLKFMSKKRKEDPIDYPVMPLEGLWWVEDGHFDIAKPGNWHYTLMIMEPPHITAEMFQEALRQLRAKRPSPALDRLRLETFHEGPAVQIMHIGPYATESATVERMHAFARQQEYRLEGKHHEIYLGDPRTAAPEKLKTVLRHAVEKADAGK